MIKTIHGAKVEGIEVDAQTRCAHYKSEIDIIAVKFKCCRRWFPCFECHEAIAAHSPEVWKIAEFETPAILCGGCGHQLTINEYLGGDSICPRCASQFNPGCARHRRLYFETDDADKFVSDQH